MFRLRSLSLSRFVPAAVAAFSLVALPISTPNSVSAQNGVIGSSQPLCPKCGQIHSLPLNGVTQSMPIQTEVAQTSFVSPTTRQRSTSQATTHRSGVSNVLSALNAQRARRGIGSLRYDPSLQAVAERRASLMASQRIKSHPSGSFAPGRYEGVGWSSSYSPSGVSACFTNDSRMTAAGAAMATGRDGVYFCVVYR